MKKIIYPLILILLVSCNEYQKKDISKADFKRISLSYGHTLNNESLIVHIVNYQRDNIHISYRYIPPIAVNPNDYQFKSYRIDSIKFDKIANDILSIDRLNIEKESETGGHDGISTGISFYEKNKNTIMNVYNVWSPDYDTKERNLEDYMNVYKELIKLSNIEPDSLFK